MRKEAAAFIHALGSYVVGLETLAATKTAAAQGPSAAQLELQRLEDEIRTLAPAADAAKLAEHVVTLPPDTRGVFLRLLDKEAQVHLGGPVDHSPVTPPTTSGEERFAAFLQSITT